MASLISDQKPKCERRQDRQSGLRPQGRVRPRCLEWGYKSRSVIAGSDLMVSKNTDRRERPLTKGATPQGKTERMATHVEAFVELTTDPGSIPGTSIFKLRQGEGVRRLIRQGRFLWDWLASVPFPATKETKSWQGNSMLRSSVFSSLEGMGNGRPICPEELRVGVLRPQHPVCGVKGTLSFPESNISKSWQGEGVRLIGDRNSFGDCAHYVPFPVIKTKKCGQHSMANNTVQTRVVTTGELCLRPHFSKGERHASNF